MKTFLRAVLIPAVLGLAACQTPHSFATPDAAWETHRGQLKFSSGERVLIGEAIVRRRGATDFQLEFAKAGGFPLLKLQMDAQTARAEGLLARGVWQGGIGSAPQPLQPWMQLRAAFLSAEPGARAPEDSAMSCESERAGGQLHRLKCTSKARGEQFEFVFAR